MSPSNNPFKNLHENSGNIAKAKDFLVKLYKLSTKR